MEAIMNIHGTPDSQEKKIQKVREDTRREIERKKRLSPVQERMKRAQLEERIFPKRIDPSQVKKHNRKVGQSMTMSEASNLYAIIVHGNGIRQLSDLEKADAKMRSYLLKTILDAQTMEKLIQVSWQIEPEVSVKSGIEQRQAISNAVKNIFF